MWKDVGVEGVFHLKLVILYFISQNYKRILGLGAVQVQWQILQMYLFFSTQLFELQSFYYFSCPEAAGKQTKLNSY